MFITRQGPTHVSLLGLALFCCWRVEAEPATNTPSDATSHLQRDGRHDFDFEVGRWKAHVKTLVHRLSHSTDWDEFSGTVVTRTLPMLEGWNESEMQVDSPKSGKRIELLAVRMYNPSTRQWVIYGSSVKSGVFDPRGIGKAIALALAKAGAAVAIAYRERSQEAASVVETIHQDGGRAAAIAADVSIASAVLGMISETEQRLGPVDILVNNAGIGMIRGLDEITEEDFDRTIAVNLKSAFLCTQAVLPGMRARRWGRIVNISSIAARGPGGLSVAYNASKAGIEGLTRGYAARLAPEGVTINAVAPGLIDTEMGKPLIEAGVPARIPIGRVGTGDEIAQVVLLLVRDAFITGQTLAVNGGTLFC